MAAMAHVGFVVGGGIKIFRRAAILQHGEQLGVAGIDHRTAQAEQLREDLLHGFGIVGIDLQPQVGHIAVGAANAKLLHLEPAAELDHRVEDLLHDVRIDQVALGFHALLQWKRLAVCLHALRFGFQLTDFQLIGYPLLQRKLDLEAGKPQEVAVVGAQRRAMFDGQCGEVSIDDQRSRGPCFWARSHSELTNVCRLAKRSTHCFGPASPTRISVACPRS